LIDSAHLRGLGRVLRSCPKMAKTAPKLSAIARRANRSKIPDGMPMMIRDVLAPALR